MSNIENFENLNNYWAFQVSNTFTDLETNTNDAVYAVFEKNCVTSKMFVEITIRL